MVALGTAVLFALTAAPASAQPEEKQYQLLFEKANTAYAQQQYETALDDYEKIMAAGLASGKLYYNAANTCFKLGSLGKAKAYYEKALKAGFQDIDLAANMSFLNSKLKDQQEEFSQNLTTRLSSMLNKQGWIVFFCVFYLGFFILALARLFLKNGRKTLNLACFFCAAMCVVGTAGYLHKRFDKTRFGIITPQSAKVMYTPSNTGETFFVLHEGAKVKITGSDGDWNQVQFGKNKRGWTQRDNILPI